MRINGVASDMLTKGVGFIRRQPRDWKITVGRSSLARFVYQMVLPYQSVYTISLGATATQLGIVNSTGMGIAGLMSPFVGWFIDRIGIKRIYIIGIIFLLVSYFTYGIAQGWMIIFVAMAAYWIGETVSGHSCATICGNSLANEDRATGMTICETVAAGLLGIIGPMIGAILVTTFGGVNTRGIRPLFLVAFIGTLVSLYLIHKKMSDHSWIKVDRGRPNFFRDIAYVLNQGKYMKRWLVAVSIGSLPLGMVFPFAQLYAHEMKGADQYIMGLMVTGFALTSLLMGVPVGRLADKIGRKKALYLTLPLFWSSNILLIWAPGNGWLIAAGILQGFYFICATITGAMSFEMVPAHQMGRWIGLMRFCRMVLSSLTAFLAGVIWDTVGPEFVFLTVMGLDILIRLPLLIGMPETLDLKKRK